MPLGLEDGIEMKTELKHVGKWLSIQRDANQFFIYLFKRHFIIDWGTKFQKENNGDLVTQKRRWGLCGHPWLQIVRLDRDCITKLDWWTEQQAFFKQQEKMIQKKKRLHPAVMSLEQRHAQTAKIVKKMHWSKTFVAAMTTPLTLQALENNGSVKSIIPANKEDNENDLRFTLTPEKLKQLAGLTKNNFKQMRAKWLQEKARFISVNWRHKRVKQKNHLLV